jgi:hypothetical protein
LKAAYSVKEAGDICNGDRPATEYKIYTYYPTVNAGLHGKCWRLGSQIFMLLVNNDHQPVPFCCNSCRMVLIGSQLQAMQQVVSGCSISSVRVNM